MLVVEGTRGVDLHDVGVCETSCGIGFALETFDVEMVVHQLGVHELEGHVPLRFGLLGEPDFGHAPFAESTEKFELAEHLADARERLVLRRSARALRSRGLHDGLVGGGFEGIGHAMVLVHQHFGRDTH